MRLRDMRWRLLGSGLLMTLIAAGCTSAESVEVSVASSPDPLSSAIQLGIDDCFDPLHDSDGSGGFFAFCDRAMAAKAVGALDCLRPDHMPGAPECKSWRVTAAEVPPYYFDVQASEPDPQSGPQPTEAPPAPAADVSEPEPEPAEVEPVEQEAETSEEPEPEPAEAEPTESEVLELEPEPADAEPTEPSESDPVESAPPAVSADQIVLEWNDTGGCAMIGDMCPARTIFADGSVEVRVDGDIVAEGNVDAELISDLFAHADVDAEALIASLPPGPCRAASDGIDTDLWIVPADLRLSTCGVDISGGDPLISAARRLGAAAVAATPIDWEALLSE